MKRLVWLLLIPVLFACAPAQAPEEPAATMPEKLIVPDSLGADWYPVSAGNTDMYAYKTEGVYDEKTGWVTFAYNGYKVLAILTTEPNPSEEDQSYNRKFDVQWVEDGMVIRHAICFDVDSYNRNLSWEDAKYYDIRLPENGSPKMANQVVVSTYGCGFEGLTGDILYIVHRHLVKSSALQELNQP